MHIPSVQQGYETSAVWRSLGLHPAQQFQWSHYTGTQGGKIRQAKKGNTNT